LPDDLPQPPPPASYWTLVGRTHARCRFRSPNSTNLPCAARLYRWLRTPPKHRSSTSTLRLVGPHLFTPEPRVCELRSKSLGRMAIDADSPRPPGWPAPPTQTNESRSEVAGLTSGCWGVTQRPCKRTRKVSKPSQTSTRSNSP
jgi:hypothetical protein